jgi:hypothetical protein
VVDTGTGPARRIIPVPKLLRGHRLARALAQQA